MTFKIFLIPTLLLSLLSCNSQTKETNDWTESNLNHKVKSIHQKSYKVNRKKYLKNKEIDSIKNFKIEFIISYSNKGKIIKKEWKKTSTELYEKWNYEYNESNNKKKVSQTVLDEKTGKYREIIRTYKYNNNKEVIEENINYFDFQEPRKYLFEYNKYGKKTKMYRRFGNSKIELYKKFEYNSNGKLLKELIYGGDDKIKLTKKYDYDSNGYIKNVEESTSYYKKSKYQKLYEYSLDSKKNWIEKIEFTNSDYITIKVREIEYFSE